jgi:hypothetical protein
MINLARGWATVVQVQRFVDFALKERGNIPPFQLLLCGLDEFGPLFIALDIAFHRFTVDFASSGNGKESISDFTLHKTTLAVFTVNETPSGEGIFRISKLFTFNPSAIGESEVANRHEHERTLTGLRGLFCFRHDKSRTYCGVGRRWFRYKDLIATY